jgi:hypothetical protein
MDGLLDLPRTGAQRVYDHDRRLEVLRHGMF